MKDESYVRIPLETLRQFLVELLCAYGLDASEAQTVVRHIVRADLRGVDTHGVVKLVEFYLRRLEEGGINPRPKPHIVRDMPWGALLDGDAGFGHLVADFAMRVAVDKAGQAGVGWVEVRNSNHFGMLASYALDASAQGFIGVCTSNASGRMAPFGGADRLLGNGPICFAFPPGEQGVTLILDMACTAAATGKIRRALLQGEAIPTDWALDADGNPTQDPASALAGVSLPIGGHKGYAIAVMVEILAGVVSGAGLGPLGTAGSPAAFSVPQDIGHVLAAVRVDAFLEPAEYRRAMTAMTVRLRASPKRAGASRIALPGEIEQEVEERNRRLGIPIHRKVVEELETAARGRKLAVSLL